MDLRVRKTREALAESLRGLLGEKTYASISVAEICERARVRRATFYKHFRDKDDLLTRLVADLLQEFAALNRVEFDPQRPGAYFTGLFSLFVDFLEANGDMARLILNSPANSAVLEAVSEMVEKDMVRILRSVDFATIDLKCDCEMVAAVQFGAVIGCARWWLAQSDRVSKEEIVEQFGEIMSRF